MLRNEKLTSALKLTPPEKISMENLADNKIEVFLQSQFQGSIRKARSSRG